MSEAGIDRIDELVEEVDGLQAELGKAQIILAFVLQEVGDVVIEMAKPLKDGAAIAVDEDAEAGTLTVRLVSE